MIVVLIQIVAHYIYASFLFDPFGIILIRGFLFAEDIRGLQHQNATLKSCGY
jgi:hypothetical protein